MKQRTDNAVKKFREHELKQFNASVEQAPGTEIVGRRGEYVKHYDLGGGRYQMVVFPEPVHYRKDGDWEEINNALSESVGENGAVILENKGNPLHAEFAKEAGESALVRLTTQGKSMHWRVAGQQAGCEAKVRQQRMGEAHSAEEQRSQAGNEYVQVVYEGIRPDMDVVYTLSGDRFKEDIILHSAEAAKEAVMELGDEYYYRVEEDGHVTAEGKEGGSVPFTFAAPVAWDANEEPVKVQMKLFGSRLTYAVAEKDLSCAAYPVTIDPSVDTSSGIEWATFKTGGTAPEDSSNMCSGKSGSTEYATAVKIKNLNWDGMRRSDTVTGAYLQVRDRSGRSSNYVAAYQILTEWNAGTVTWDTLECGSAGEAEHEHIAPVMLDCKAGGGTVKLDITRAYRDWKDTGKNYGILLRRPHGMTEKCYMRMRYPVLYVNYVSHAGEAGWWEYAEQSAGRAGTAKVDLFNGNLVYEHADIQMTGNRMPVSVSHYYNSCLSAGGESDDPKVSNDYHCGKGFKLNVQQCVSAREAGGDWYYVWTDGSGLEHWFKKKASGSESKDLEGMNYKLVYKKKTSSALEQITITDSEHTVMTFKRRNSGKHAQWVNYWLVEVCDSVRRKSGVYNKNVYEYEMPEAVSDAEAVGEYEGMVKKITDSAGREVIFAYNEARRLSEITWPGETGEDGTAAERRMYFGYDEEGRLTGVGYYDMQTSTEEVELNTHFGYENNLLTSAENYDGKRVEIHYDHEGIEDGHGCSCGCAYCCGGLGDSARVKTLEFSAAGKDGSVVRGGKQLFEYEALETTITVVENAETDEGKKLKYQFNASGNVIGMQDELGYAQFVKFSPNTPNKPTDVSKLQRVVVNQLAPFSEADEWIGENAVVGYVKGSSGNSRRLLGVPTALLKENGTVRQKVKLKQSGSYTASVYAYAENPKNPVQAKLKVKVNGALVGTDAADVEMMQQENAIGLSGWARMSCTFEAGTGAGEAEAEIELVNESEQDVWFGWAQLEAGETANHVNLMYNADFTKGFSTNPEKIELPSGWSKDKEFALDENNRAVNLPEGSPEILTGNCLKITSTPKKSKRKVYQVLPIAGAKDSVFTVGGWAKALSLPGEEGKKPYFDIGVSFRNKSNKYAKTLYLSFNKSQRDWQYACRAVLAPYEFTAVRVECVYSYNAEHALFTNLFLSREEFGQSYVYDDDKDVVSVSDRSSQKSKAKYDNAKNVISYRKPGKENTVVYTANYGSTKKEREQHLPVWEKTPEGVVKRYEYDEYGNTIKTRVQKSGDLGKNDLCIGSKTEYDDNGMFAVSVTDACGNSARKEIDANTGRVKSAQDPFGTNVSYMYDGLDRVTDVVCQPDAEDASIVYRNHYTYSEDKLKTVSHNTTNPEECDVTYAFDYDKLGRKTTVHVGDQLLSRNVYAEDRSGLLKEVQYGNGGRVRYQHDEFDRTTGIFYDNEAEPRYCYSYDAEGRVAKVEDKNLNRTIWTEYDLAGRPVRTNQTEVNEAGEQELIYRTRLGYAKDNNLQEFIETVGDENYRTIYNYDKDDRTEKMAFESAEGIQGIQYEYDGVGRITEVKRGAATVDKNGKKITLEEDAALKTKYEYCAGDTEQFGSKAATSLVSKITHGDNALNFEYSYDACGNILSVNQYEGTTAPEVATTQYQYDKLGQLIRVNDIHDKTSGENGTTWAYEYDLGGNILSKKRYGYTTGSLEGVTPVEEIPYVYNQVWKDRLDYYNGKPIVYDEIGNPVQYDGTTYEWTAGRQLKRMTIRNNADADGIDIEDGVDAASGTKIRIMFPEGNTIAGDVTEIRAVARVYRKDIEITDELPAESFEWSRSSGDADADADWAEAHRGMKEILLTAADMDGDIRIHCTLTGEASSYGTVQVTDDLIATHTPNGADSSHVFSVEKGMLVLNVPEEAEEEAAEDEPEADPDEQFEVIDADDEELPDPVEEVIPEEDDESSEEDPEEDIPEEDAEIPDEGMDGEDYIAGEEETEEELVNETPDIVYTELDEQENEDAGRVPKGISYTLVDGHLMVDVELDGSITASAKVYSSEPDMVVEYNYSEGGIRTSKTVRTAEEEKKTDYILHGKILQHLGVGDEKLSFFYGADAHPTQVEYNGKRYTYLYSLQADVTGIIDEDGQPVVRYVYDAWGRTIEMTGSMAENLGRLNPFRYRSYIYDPETELYYLGSRYYSPEQSRFINADVNMGECGTLITHNVFTYCGNSATMYSDASGEFFEVAAIMSVAAMSFLSIIALGVVLTAFALLVHNAISKAPPDVYRETDSAAEIIQQAAMEMSAEYKDGKKYEGHSVYLLVENNIVFYVGRTNDPGRRLKEHKNGKFSNRIFRMRIVMSGLSENEAKVLEQFLISAFFGINLQNARREIGRLNLRKYLKYMGAVKDLFICEVDSIRFLMR